jgi:hypothetical protein
MRCIPSWTIGLSLLAVLPCTVTESPSPAPEAASYDIRRLNDYAARVSWRFVHNDDSHTQVCGSEGSAIFLGGNQFLTAAHVVDQNPFTDACADFGAADPVIEFRSAQLRARVVRSAPWYGAERLIYPGGMDLALLEVDAGMIPVELRSVERRAVCDADPPVSAEVRVATEYGIDIAAVKRRPAGDFVLIELRPKHGYSGGGIFDPMRGCLVGIISNGGAAGTNYVPNDVLRSFLRAAQPGTAAYAETPPGERR